MSVEIAQSMVDVRLGCPFLIFELDGNCGDHLDYEAVPDPAPLEGWNPNSYAHGLLIALGALDPDIDAGFDPGGVGFPGWEPLALSEFGVEEEE